MDSLAVDKCRGTEPTPEVEQDQVGALERGALVERMPMDWARWVPLGEFPAGLPLRASLTTSHANSAVVDHTHW